MIQDRAAKLRTRFPEEVEFALTLLSVKSIHFLRDRQNVEPIGIIEGHGKPENRKLPRAQHPLMRFNRSSSPGPALRKCHHACAQIRSLSMTSASACATCSLSA